HATTEQYETINSMDAKQRMKMLDKLIDSAFAASQLKEDTHFVIRTEKRGDDTICYARILMSDGSVSNDAQWSDGVHQCLHARLNTEKKGEYLFPIESETTHTASTTAKDFVDYYKERGVIWGMTGTIGSEDERKEQQSVYGIDMTKLPPHQISMRKDREPELIQGGKNAHQEAIFTEVRTHLK